MCERVLKEFEGHYCKIMKYDVMEVDFFRGAIIARMGKEDLYSGAYKLSCRELVSVVSQQRCVESRKGAVSISARGLTIQGAVWTSFAIQRQRNSRI